MRVIPLPQIAVAVAAVALLLADSGHLARGAAAALQTFQTRDVAIGDAFVSLDRRISANSGVAKVRPDQDPRFQNQEALKFVAVVFQPGSAALRLQGIARALRGAEQPQLYPTTSQMSVFRHPDSGAPVIRVNGATFLGAPLVVICDLRPFRVPVRGGSWRVDRKCDATQQLGNNSYVSVVFVDGRVPASGWKELFQNLETGIRAMTRIGRN